jgi:hypothetical protein
MPSIIRILFELLIIKPIYNFNHYFLCWCGPCKFNSSNLNAPRFKWCVPHALLDQRVIFLISHASISYMHFIIQALILNASILILHFVTSVLPSNPFTLVSPASI